MKYMALIKGEWVNIPGWFYEELKQNKALVLRRGGTVVLLPSITCLLTIKQ